MIRSSINIVKESFHAKTSSRKNIKPFLLYKSIDKPFIVDSFTGEWNNKQVYISVIQYYTSVKIGRIYNAGIDNYFVGVITLKDSYPHIIIKPEVLALKIENLFTKMDVDFEHARWFSFLFYVITKDKEALKLKFNAKDLNKIAKFLNAELEIIGCNCYFRVSRKAISMSEARKFVQLGKILAELF